MPQDIKETIQFKHIDKEQVHEKQQAALRAKFKENLAKQNAESKKRSTMHETSAAEEQQNRVESILEHVELVFACFVHCTSRVHVDVRARELEDLGIRGVSCHLTHHVLEFQSPR